MLDDIAFVAQTAIKYSIAVSLAALGEIVVERAGILNLGVQGMMLLGALAGFAVGYYTGHPLLALAASMAAGGLLSLVHALFSIRFRANQVLSGLALTILGAGLSNFLGRPLISAKGIRIVTWNIPGLADIPFLGRILFQQNPLVYATYILVPAIWYFLYRSKTGLRLRACGQDAAAADAAGVPVALYRTLATAFGGMMAGLAGAYLSLAYTPGWKEDIGGGQGWIAIAMVIFATWRPYRAFWGGLLFGLLSALQVYFQIEDIRIIPVYILRMLPYLLTIGVLVFINSLETVRRRAGAPADLGVPFHREQ